MIFLKKRKNKMITREQGLAYAKVALHFLQVLHIDITPRNLKEQMELIYDLYEKSEILHEGKKY